MTKNLPRTVLAGAIGNAIEFYDFIVYAYLATYFASQFFPTTDPVAALIASYGAFASGMVMRPVGGVIFGNIGDRIGRKVALQISVVLIAVPTLLIGLLPTYSSIGLWAPGLLILLRMLQGLSIGGEYSASIVFLIERSPPGRRGFIGSFSPMGAFGGLFLGTAMSFLCIASLGESVMHEWGWRVPFVASAVLTLIGMIARYSLGQDNTQGLDKHKAPVREAFRNYWRKMLSIALANTATGIVSFVGFMFAVPWMVKNAGVDSSHALAINLCSLILVGLFAVLGGWLGDRVGRIQVARLGVFILLVGAWPAFMLFTADHFFVKLLGGLILALGQGFFVGPLCASMAALLPKHVRVTGISFGYSLSVGIFGGFAPMLTEYLMARQQIVMAPALVIMAGAVVSLATLLWGADWRHAPESFPEERQ